ncbi:MAG: HlyD family secretion protein, partial [Stellaceae bacterium]
MSSETLDRGAAPGFAPDSRTGVLTRRFRPRRRWGLGALGVLVAGAVAWYGWGWWQVGRFIETTDDAYVGGNVTAIAPHVAGFVTEILAGDNQYVKAGQLLVRLDDRDYQAKLAHAQAVVERQTAALAN